jgi:hypothetical protein
VQYVVGPQEWPIPVLKSQEPVNTCSGREQPEFIRLGKRLRFLTVSSPELSSGGWGEDQCGTQT